MRAPSSFRSCFVHSRFSRPCESAKRYSIGVADRSADAVGRIALEGAGEQAYLVLGNRLLASTPGADGERWALP
jgi:hypothetical protein